MFTGNLLAMSQKERPQLLIDPVIGEVLGANAAACSFFEQSERLLQQTSLNQLLKISSAQMDPLTHLPNRQLFLDRLQQSLNALPRARSGLAVLFIDLDRFKPINDTLGHQAGDVLLIQVAQRLQALLRKQDTLARIGGDEFVVLLKEVNTNLAVEQVAQNLLNALAQPFELPKGTVEIGGSIGVAIGPQDAQDAEGLLQKADLAMYRAKQNGRQQWLFFSQALDQEARRKFHMEQKLREALESGQLSLQFEPLLNPQETSVFALDAQVSHYSLNGLGQDWQAILPMLNQSILGVQFSEWQIQEWVCVQQMLTESNLSVPIMVRIPGVHFRQKNFVDFIEDVLELSGLDPNLLLLQLDETSLNQSSVDVTQQIQRLNDLGVQVILEQFGLQGVSLLQLANLPFVAIKMGDLGLGQRSGVGSMPLHRNTQLAAAILAFAYQLNKNLIASELQAEDQWLFMQSQHCQWGQGSLFGEPLDAEDLVAYLANLYAQRDDVLDEDSEILDTSYEDFDD